MEKYSAVIIEPRIHPAWKLVLNNFLTNLDERWNFIIFCGLLNKEFLQDLIDTNFKEHKNRITIHQINIENFTIKEYSNFMVQPLIYEMIPTETFLTFQLDTLISAKYKDYIYDFIEYDYVGAPCGKIVYTESVFETKNYIGNGGLSLRKKSVILNLIKNDLYNIRYGGPEDIFFSQNITNKPRFKKAILFSVETIFSERSFGIHKCYMSLSNDKLCKIAEYIPEIFELAELNKIHHNY
jgi:hypothetical protein